MKLGSIGIVLARLFHGRARISVIDQLKDASLIKPEAWVDVPEPVPSIGSTSAPSRPGVKPPDDHSVDNLPEWNWWLAQRGLARPGWAFCRFANRCDTKAVFAFGWARGSFGIWEQPRKVCSGMHPNVVQQEKIVAKATHLPTGHMIGVFSDVATAIEACELAERIDGAWATESSISPALDAAITRTNQAWMGVGIVVAPYAHVHDGGDDVANLLIRSVETVMEGRPERLS